MSVSCPGWGINRDSFLWLAGYDKSCFPFSGESDILKIQVRIQLPGATQTDAVGEFGRVAFSASCFALPSL